MTSLGSKLPTGIFGLGPEDVCANCFQSKMMNPLTSTEMIGLS